MCCIGPRAWALLFNCLRVVSRSKFYDESENAFLINGRWWVMREIGICVGFWHFLCANLLNVSFFSDQCQIMTNVVSI